MNNYLFAAGILSFLLGLIHSILGERLIFKNKRRKGYFVPSMEVAGLKERHIRILWATWHLASVFGWSIAAILIKLSLNQEAISGSNLTFFVQSIQGAMFLSSVLVLVGTKGKHPGWIVLLTIALLLFGANG